MIHRLDTWRQPRLGPLQATVDMVLIRRLKVIEQDYVLGRSKIARIEIITRYSWFLSFLVQALLKTYGQVF